MDFDVKKLKEESAMCIAHGFTWMFGGGVFTFFAFSMFIGVLSNLIMTLLVLPFVLCGVAVFVTGFIDFLEGKTNDKLVKMIKNKDFVDGARFRLMKDKYNKTRFFLNRLYKVSAVTYLIIFIVAFIIVGLNS